MKTEKNMNYNSEKLSQQAHQQGDQQFPYIRKNVQHSGQKKSPSEIFIEQQQQQARNFHNRESTNDEDINYEDGQKTSTDPQIYNNIDYQQNSSTKENCSGDNDDCTKPLYGQQGFYKKQQQNQQNNQNVNQNKNQNQNQNQQSNLFNNNNNQVEFNKSNNYNNNNGNSNFYQKQYNGTFNQLPNINSNGYFEGEFNSSGNLMSLQGQEQPVFSLQDDIFRDIGDRNYDVKIEQNYEDPNNLNGVKSFGQFNLNGNGNRSLNFNGSGNFAQLWNPTQLQSQNSGDPQNNQMVEDINQQNQYAQQPQQQGQQQQNQRLNQQQQNGYMGGGNQLQNQNPLFMQYNLSEGQQFGNTGFLNNNNVNNNNFQNQQQQLFYNNNNINQLNQNRRNKVESSLTTSPNTTYNIEQSENQNQNQNQSQQEQKQQKKGKKQQYKQEYTTQSDSFDDINQDNYTSSKLQSQTNKLLNKKIKKEKQGYHKEYQKIDHNRQTCPSEYCRKFREKGVNTQSDKCPVYQQKLRSQKQQNSQRQRDDEKSYMAKFVIYTQALLNKLRNKGVDIDNEEEVKELTDMGENIVQRKKYQESVERERKNYQRVFGPVNLINAFQFIAIIFFLGITINSVVYVGVFEETQYPIRLNNRNLEEDDPQLGKYLDDYYFCNCYSKDCSELDFLKSKEQQSKKDKGQNGQAHNDTKCSDNGKQCREKVNNNTNQKDQPSFYENKKENDTQQASSASENVSKRYRVEEQGLNTCALIKIQKKNKINSRIFKMKNNIQETKKLWSQKKHDQQAMTEE